MAGCEEGEQGWLGVRVIVDWVGWECIGVNVKWGTGDSE